MSTPLHAVSRLPSPGDNVAIAIRRLEAGEILEFAAGPRALPHTVLEGHRFAVAPITPGASLLSWGLPFGRALRPIAPGDYVANRAMLEALTLRQLDGAVLPPEANFEDSLERFVLDEASIRPAPPVPRATPARTFFGYRRPGRRGVGTRNTIVILGTSSRTSSFARQLTARLQVLARVHPSLDGIVAIAHTEGGGTGEPNNTQEVLRALAGFIIHPNVGAVLAVDYGVEPINNTRLREFMHSHGYPLDDVPHAFLTLDRGLAAGLSEGERLVRAWLPQVSALTRSEEPLSGLRIALQCGGSDAFSGVSGNPLAGAMVHEAIRHGATGVLTETDESMGAEGYMLKNVRDLGTARAFIGKLDRFREKLSWHGLTPESNPSAGNRFRGLYNIALKSLGAVHKKDPRTRLDTIIDYAQPLWALTEPGFTFMNGPGNDLEGIAGQVGAGCNLILFVTGNGSITNFPFVPTLKITTTTRRHELLIHEMDINAGRYLDGESMEFLCADAFEMLVATASGQKTRGEHAGHSQVSIWRNWRQTDTSQLPALRARIAPDGVPLRAKAAPVAEHATPSDPENSTLVGRTLRVSRGPLTNSEGGAGFDGSAGTPRPTGENQSTATKGSTDVGFGISPETTLCPPPSVLRPPLLSLFRRADGRYATERLGLILPTSLCSTQIARLAAERLNAKKLGATAGITRFVGFTHTEGCGFGGETMYHLLHRTYRGYLTHPNVAAALLLEHGCEKVPNDVIRHHLAAAGVKTEQFGWASVQLDGGIDRALAKVEKWFDEKLATLPAAPREKTTFGALSLALLTATPVTPATARTLASLTCAILDDGGSVLLAESDPLLANPQFWDLVLGQNPAIPTVAEAVRLSHPGCNETLTRSATTDRRSEDPKVTIPGPIVPHATLTYGEPLARPGLHVVATESDHWVENLTGLCGCGAHVALTIAADHARQGHPMLDVIQAAEAHLRGRLAPADIDVFLTGDPVADQATLTLLITATAQRDRPPVANTQGFVDFQLTRGLLGLTT